MLYYEIIDSFLLSNQTSEVDDVLPTAKTQFFQQGRLFTESEIITILNRLYPKNGDRVLSHLYRTYPLIGRYDYSIHQTYKDSKGHRYVKPPFYTLMINPRGEVAKFNYKVLKHSSLWAIK